MNAVGAYEAKTRLPELLKRVAQGEHVTITKHGVAVARLVPVSPSEGADPAAVIQELKRFRRGRSLGGMDLREMINEGRRF